MKYVLSEKTLSLVSKKPIYLTDKEQGNFIVTTDKIEEAKTFNTIEELDSYAKLRKLKKKDFVVVEIEGEENDS